MNEKKILLVEDDHDHAELIIDIIEEESGKDVILKTDGQEAIDFFLERSTGADCRLQSEIEVVILDLNLPKVSGMDVLEFLKNDPKYYLIPVIIFSTSTDHRTIAEAYKRGANGYMSKPLSYEEFIQKIKLLKDYWLKANESPELKQGIKGRILIADDEGVFLESTADLLRREGYECDCVIDSNAVMEKMKTAKYDLLIADINMPGNVELELIKKLPAIGEKMPVILATGNLAFHAEFQSIKHPVVAYMFKPLNFDKLLAQVRISIESFKRRN